VASRRRLGLALDEHLHDSRLLAPAAPASFVNAVEAQLPEGSSDMQRRRYNPLGLALALGLIVTLANAQDLGRFKGEPVVVMLADGRNMRLVQSFAYVDSKGRAWEVPAGAETDGASIPRALWLTHPPFTGKYRSAAVIHDYYCQKKVRPWRDTHQVFYDAMRTAGVPETSAKVMYGAVYNFGPRWGVGVLHRGPGAKQYPTVDKQAEAIRDLEAWINRDNPSPEEITKALDKGQVPK